MKNNKIVIIGARGGSKRVYNKNIRNLGKYPLIGHTLITANLLGYPTYVSSDSDIILDTVEEFKKNLHNEKIHLIKRPKELASDEATDIDWIKHLLTEHYKSHNNFPEQLIFLRPTTPFREVKIVRKAIEQFDSIRYSSLRSAHELSESGFKTFIINNGYLQPLSRCDVDKPNQLVPPTYSGNGYVDILDPKQILEFNTLYGNSIQPFVTPYTVEIDTEEDIKYANWLLQERK
jgi:CMP-N-acetylneuraminic acid synthetase